MAGVFFDSANELATVTNLFQVDGTATDPDTVSLVITDPTGVSTTPTPTKTGTGAYKYDVACDGDGTWQYTWVGTGAATDTVAGTWEVQDIQLGHLYCTVEALKNYLNIDDDDDDLEVHGACITASRWIEEHCERTFWRTLDTEVRTFAPDDWWLLRLPEFNDLVSVTSILTDQAGDGVFETTWAASDYQLLTGTAGRNIYNPQAGPERKPYTAIKSIATRRWPWIYTTPSRSDRVQITGVFGWPAIPRAVKQAAKQLAAEAFRRKDAPFGVSGEGAFVQTFVPTNLTAVSLLGPYRRNPALMA